MSIYAGYILHIYIYIRCVLLVCYLLQILNMILSGNVLPCLHTGCAFRVPYGAGVLAVRIRSNHVSVHPPFRESLATVDSYLCFYTCGNEGNTRGDFPGALFTWIQGHNQGHLWMPTVSEYCTDTVTGGEV